VGIFSEGKDSRGDHGLGRLVEFRFKGPPGTTSSYITTHIIGTTYPRLMGVPTSEVGYTSAMPRREAHEVHKDMWGHWKEKNKNKKTTHSLIYVSTTIIYWVIHATCFDLLTGLHQASSRISQRCC